jgi:LysR family glycine cleavage system transcriptional activator
MSRLPTVTALRAFEAAARHLSFKRAAGELAVTPTAISHQVRQLEEELGKKLFRRTPRKVELTPEGQDLFPVVRNAFASMAMAVDRIRTPTRDRVLTLSATTGFTARWLIPRLAGLKARGPGFTLRLHASDDPVDLHGGEADLAIRYGTAPFPGLVAEPVLEESFAPMCSPALAIRSYSDLQNAPLLRSEWRLEDARTPSWKRWHETAGLPAPNADAATVFTDDNHLILATLAGQGVALLSPVLVAEELASGALVRPFGPELAGETYYLVHTGREDLGTDLPVLRDWLKGETACGIPTQ